MRWPTDHPANTDPALAPFADAAARLAYDFGLIRVRRLLRHLPGRRAASLVDDGGDRLAAVLKVFASPRARGNDRRLRSLGDSGAADVLPRSIAIDPTGHVSLVEWAPGVVFGELGDDAFIGGAGLVGAALHRLHCSGAWLDRTWNLDKELAQLRRRSTARNAPLIAAVEDDAPLLAQLASEPLVSAHRDCHPRQVVIGSSGACWIDLDDCAMAPAGLDVGNFLAHLRRDTVIGRRGTAASSRAREAFVAGYGSLPATTQSWERLSLIRLVALAESRHGRRDWADALVEAAASSDGRVGR